MTEIRPLQSVSVLECYIYLLEGRVARRRERERREKKKRDHLSAGSFPHMSATLRWAQC